MIIDVDKIKGRLFSEPKICCQLICGYELSCLPTDVESAWLALLNVMGLKIVADPLVEKYDNTRVFKAAAWALGSNRRKWATFRRYEKKFEELLSQYDTKKAREAAIQDKLLQQELARCLPGQTSRKDSIAILGWAKVLTDV